tara:strand:- start:566 stop:1567 length:1002 start_codon:yes stop_codon:yes gene_type:complete
LDSGFLLISGIVVLALIFDFWNGMNDAANSVATIVSTRVLKPFHAVMWAAFWNFAAAFGFGVAVANTIGKGIVNPEIITEYLILAALIGAISWVMVATRLGIPISVSHALIGGLLGAGFAKGGLAAILLTGKVQLVLLFIFLAPIIGAVAGFLAQAFVLNLVKNMSQYKINNWFRKLQLVSAASYSLGHGTNDAQKTMGIIAVLLFSAGYLGDEFYVPVWVILAAHTAIALGTLAGGWRVINTMGMKITKLHPIHGFTAESSAALTLLGTATFGIPVSTTHVIAGSIMGVGSTKRLSAVRWGLVRKIILTWIVTIPISSVVAYLSYNFLLTFV